jgi:hypothetical protein
MLCILIASFYLNKNDLNQNHKKIQLIYIASLPINNIQTESLKLVSLISLTF